MIPKNKLSALSRICLIVGAILMAASIFLPMWQIDLFAPQYPEGLELLIYPDSLAGDVDVINGLNHYIGMKTLHTEDFYEFKILPFLLGFIALCFAITAIIGRKKIAYLLLGFFVLFSVISMADFYRWNYNYGHDLDPHAAIKVPGMAYQPPLIGYKQLLNFGAYSMPATGGILFITAGVLLLVVVLAESGTFRRIFKKKKSIAALTLSLGIFACTEPGPRAIELNVEECAYCKMTVTDANFAAQLTTAKGRHYVFDDISCMIDFRKENPDIANHNFYVADFSNPDHFVELNNSFLFKSDSLRSPMRGNIAVFAVRDSMTRHMERLQGVEVTWDQLINQ